MVLEPTVRSGPEWAREEGRVSGDSLEEVLSSYREEYEGIEDEYARTSYIASRKTNGSRYQCIRYQEELDDLKIRLEELETEVSGALFERLDELLEERMPDAVDAYLESSRRDGTKIEPPETRREVRSILYRMYRGGSFYPLIYPRDMALQFYRCLAEAISGRDMRGGEIAAKLRKMVIRSGYPINERVDAILRETPGIDYLGTTAWSWRRNKVVKRPSYYPHNRRRQALRIADILRSAIEHRHLVGRTRVR